MLNIPTFSTNRIHKHSVKHESVDDTMSNANLDYTSARKHSITLVVWSSFDFCSCAKRESLTILLGVYENRVVQLLSGIHNDCSNVSCTPLKQCKTFPIFISGPTSNTVNVLHMHSRCQYETVLDFLSDPVRSAFEAS